MFQTIPYIMFVKHTIREDTHVSYSLHLVLLFLLSAGARPWCSFWRGRQGPAAWVKCSMPSTRRCFLTASWDMSKYCTGWYTAHVRCQISWHRSGPDMECCWFIARIWDSTSMLPAHDSTWYRSFHFERNATSLVLNKSGLHETGTFTSINFDICFLCKPQQQCPYPDFGLSLQKLNDVEKLPWNSAWQTTFRSSHV